MWNMIKDDNNKLLKIKMSDKLNLDELSDILKAIYTENDGKNSNYNRFADLSDLKDIEIDFDTACSRISDHARRTWYEEGPLKGPELFKFRQV